MYSEGDTEKDCFACRVCGKDIPIEEWYYTSRIWEPDKKIKTANYHHGNCLGSFQLIEPYTNFFE